MKRRGRPGLVVMKTTYFNFVGGGLFLRYLTVSSSLYVSHMLVTRVLSSLLLELVFSRIS